MVGSGKLQHVIYLIDFGLSKRYRDLKTGEHIPYRDQKELTGTVRYASVNTHAGIEQSRRDDLESLGFVLIYFLKGSLPWQGIKAKSKKEKYDAIKAMKTGMTIENICQGCPEEFYKYIYYCHALKFEETPDYAYLKKLFRDLSTKRGLEMDFMFDWFSPKKAAAAKKEYEATQMTEKLATIESVVKKKIAEVNKKEVEKIEKVPEEEPIAALPAAKKLLPEIAKHKEAALDIQRRFINFLIKKNPKPGVTKGLQLVGPQE